MVTGRNKIAARKKERKKGDKYKKGLKERKKEIIFLVIFVCVMRYSLYDSHWA
jgi:hypothetical protein